MLLPPYFNMFYTSSRLVSERVPLYMGVLRGSNNMLCDQHGRLALPRGKSPDQTRLTASTLLYLQNNKKLVLTITSLPT